jgi:hypothetical protein
MIAYEFDSQHWGGPRRAMNARQKQATELQEAGYRCFYGRVAYGTDQIFGYVLLAVDPMDIRPMTPDVTERNRLLREGGLR